MTSKRIRDWNPEQLPDLSGRRYLISGGNSGIGLEAAKMLAGNGADIAIACRNPAKAQAAAQEIDQCGGGSVDSFALDLSDLRSVRQAAEDVRGKFDSLDGLVNNAGIMQTPETRTVDGFELQLGTNHLGHFLFAGLLFDLVENAEGRIAVVSSIAHRLGKIHFDDLMLESGYTPSKAYGQSKLANLMFALELARRLKAAGSAVMAVACHPGYSNTNLQSTGPEGMLERFYRVLNKVAAQSSYRGAIPTVLAVAGDEAESGSYYGPTSVGEAWGPVGNAAISRRAGDKEVAAQLWQRSEELVEFTWPL